MTTANSQFFAILTAVGEAKQANANALGMPWTFSHMGVGDANGTDPIPSRGQIRLINERRRAPLNQLKVDPANSSIIIAEQVIPPDVGGWWIREIGLYDAAGDLVAVANCAPSFKPLLSQGTGKTQVVRLNIMVRSTANVELKIDPAVVLATREYVDASRESGEQYARNQLAEHLQAPDPHGQYQLRGSITTLYAGEELKAKDAGVFLLDASIGARTYTLPVSNEALGIRDFLVRRIDNSGHRLVVRASGSQKIKFHTHLRAEGYPFLVLMGAGDFWHLRSDGAGGWWPIARYDSTPLGRPVFETTTAFQPGGWASHGGFIYNRAEWPWAWDHAQVSGLLTTEALRVGKEGCWTDGDGALTFRSPEGRGEFFRVLDESRGIDAARTAGSSQGDAIRNISGSVSSMYRAGNTVATGAMRTVVYSSVPAKLGAIGADPGDGVTVNFDASLQVPTATENRSRNIAYPGRIKLI